MTCGRVLASIARSRRCSTSARANGFRKTRCGRRNVERVAVAVVAAVVMGDQRHRHFGAGPGMVGQILDRLADAVLGARLRQNQRELRRAVERVRRLLRFVARRRRGVLARERRFRLRHAVIVFEPVRQQQRAAILRLRIFGELDGRRIVGNGVERPGQTVAGAAQRRRAGRRDRKAMLLGAGRSAHRLFRRRDAAAAGNIEIDLAGRAHDQRRVDRHGERPVVRPWSGACAAAVSPG